MAHRCLTHIIRSALPTRSAELPQRGSTAVGALVGKLKFNKTPQGELAMGMVERGELGSLSTGYRVTKWLIRDENGDEVDQEEPIGWDDKLSFEATRWQLLEASLVLINAEGSGTSIRSLDGNRDWIADIRARMLSRQRMHERAQSATFGTHDD